MFTLFFISHKKTNLSNQPIKSDERQQKNRIRFIFTTVLSR